MDIKSTVMYKTLIFYVCILLFMLFSVRVMAGEVNQDVAEDTQGVVQLKVVYTDDDQDNHDVQAGTGFLVNNNTVITCDHVITVDETTLRQAARNFGKNVSDIKNRLSIEVSVMRDVSIKATVINESAEMDYAILNMETQLFDRKFLRIRSSDSVQQTETAYALGFPGEVERFQDINTYTSEDVTITNGHVNKINMINGVDYIQSSAKITEGNSGGPLVDGSGNVIGICQGSTGEAFDKDYYYAIAVDQLTQVLTSLGIEWDSVETVEAVDTVENTDEAAEEASEVVEVPELPEVDKSELQAAIENELGKEEKGYTADSWAGFSAALTEAQSVMDNDDSSQSEVDEAIKKLGDADFALVNKPAGIPVWLIAVIAGVVILIIVVIVIVIINGNSKKVSPESYNKPTPGDSFGTSKTNLSMGHNTDGTTLLDQGGGGTNPIIVGNAAKMGSLIRSKTGEKIEINQDQFVIGKKLSSVNYCISDNTSVSRTHVRISGNNGAVYATDLHSTNGTFVNGIRLNPNQDTIIKDGDKLTLADEEFVYHSF